MTHSDIMQRFVFQERAIRGQIVHLNASYKAITQHHTYPKAIQTLLGQAVCAATLLSSTLKFKGRLSIQYQGDRDLTLLLAESTDTYKVRAVARYDEGQSYSDDLPLMPSGHLAINILAEGHQQGYQGLVAMQGNSLPEAIDGYFKQSEQLPTRLWLYADRDYACGLMLQVLPNQNSEQLDEDWAYACHIADTLQPHELMRHDTITLLHKLYHEDDINLYDLEPVYFRCGCSREKLTQTITQFGKADAQALIKERGMIEATCEFCRQTYTFDAIDVEQIFQDNCVTSNDDKKH